MGLLLCVDSCGKVIEYPLVEEVFSLIIPNLLTPGIVTSTRCVSHLVVLCMPSLHATCSMLGLLRLDVRFSKTILPHPLQTIILAGPSNKCDQIYQPDAITLEPNEISSENRLHGDIEWDLLRACDSLHDVFLSIIPDRAA